MRKNTKRVLAVGAGFMLAAGGAVGASAATGVVTPQTDTHVYFCYNNKDSSKNYILTHRPLRACMPGYSRVVALSDQFKVQNGKDGADGKDGTDGKDGADGAPGLANVNVNGPYPGATQLQGGATNSTDKWVGDGGHKQYKSWVTCAPGQTAISGGFGRGDEGDAATHNLQIVSSQPAQIKDGVITSETGDYTPIAGDPNGAFVPNGWLVEGYNNAADGELIVRPFVTCADTATTK